MIVFAIYRSPHGSPAPFLVQRWEGEPGKRAMSAAPVFAATLLDARDVIPAGLVRHDPLKVSGEAALLLETWEEPKR